MDPGLLALLAVDLNRTLLVWIWLWVRSTNQLAYSFTAGEIYNDIGVTIMHTVNALALFITLHGFMSGNKIQ